MAIINFPLSPVLGDSYNYGGKTWKFNGVGWVSLDSSVTQAALDLKAPLASPTFTGTVAGITAAMVGLGSVSNTADLDKPISNAQQTALDLKAPLTSPTFNGIPLAPTAANGTATSQIATTAFVLANSGTYTNSETAPIAPVAGDRWFDSSSGIQYSWYVDTDPGQWISVSGATAPLTNTPLSLSFSIPDIPANTISTTDLVLQNTLFAKQTVIFFMINTEVSSVTNYSLSIVEVDSNSIETTVYQTSAQTTSTKDLFPFTFDRMTLANGLKLKFQNLSNNVISGSNIRILAQGFN